MSLTTTSAAAERPPRLLQASSPTSPFLLALTQDSTVSTPPEMADRGVPELPTSQPTASDRQDHDGGTVMDVDSGIPESNTIVAPGETETEAPSGGNDAMDIALDQTSEATINTRSFPATSENPAPPNINSNQTETQAPETDLTAPSSETAAPDQTSPTPQAEVTPQPSHTESLATPTSPQPPVEEQRDNDSSSEDENMNRVWQEIIEDTSAPDEKELKEIEAAGEVNALEYKHWEEKTFVDVKDPEHKPGESGRFEWLIERYNGSKDNPNSEIVMRSGVHRIAGHDWQIKFYPRGNDSDYVSVYLDNLTVSGGDAPGSIVPTSPRKQSPGRKTQSRTSKKPQKSKAVQSPKPNPEHLHTPIPLLDRTPIPKRRSVAAQISVIMYNPAEPRVHAFHTAQHRFCPQSTDWGWTRFYGPHYEIQLRHRGQRQAMLRNDKLAFTAFIRVFDDITDCLWEHSIPANPWNNFTMTGIRGLKCTGPWVPDGNMIAAVSSLLLLRPVRNILHRLQPPNSFAEGYVPPKPMLLGLLRVLHGLRHQGSQPVSLEPILDAFRWYGINTDIRALDPVHILDILRIKLQHELDGSIEWRPALEVLFGIPKNNSTGQPSYRIDPKKHKSIRSAFETAATEIVDPIEAPVVLRLEIQRQEFDTEPRVWKKVVEKVKLDERIPHPQGNYVLYGFIAHKDNLHSGSYYSVLRPNGPGTKWYQFFDSKHNHQVQCLTRKQAVDAHEGRSPQNHEKQHSPVACVVFYVREDISKSAFFPSGIEAWDVPANVSLLRGIPVEPSSVMGAPPVPSRTHVAPNGRTDGLRPQKLRVFDATKFATHEGPGFVHIFEHNGNTQGVYSLEIQPTWSAKDIQKELAKIIPGVQHPKQLEYYLWYASGPDQICQFASWSHEDSDYDAGNGSGEDICTLIKEKPDAIPLLWVFVIPFERLRKVTMGRTTTGSISLPQIDQSASASSTGATGGSSPDSGGDIVMSDVEDDVSVGQTRVVVETVNDGPGDVSTSPSNPDSEMSGTQDHATGTDNVAGPSAPQRDGSPEEDMAFVNEDPEMGILLKHFDPHAQRLTAVGAYWITLDKHIHASIVDIMGWDKSTTFKIYEETDTLETNPVEETTLKSNDTMPFEHLGLPDISILIVQQVLSDREKDALLTEGKFDNPITYIRHHYLCKNFPFMASGRVELDYFTQERYTGEILHGLPHGEGTKIYHNNTVYTGTFRLGQRHGQGTMIYSTGDTYTGSWHRGLRRGHGELLESATGNKYIGNWEDDKKSGEGTTYWKRHANDERMCRICWEGTADTAFYDCGHVVACQECAGQVESCPVCRKRVLARLRLFFVS